uniref:Uncharacterized protein n=1 Tax=Anopheles darlingi TaxID=43151 RepID=A0A2M4D8Z4_ANODA
MHPNVSSHFLTNRFIIFKLLAVCVCVFLVSHVVVAFCVLRAWRDTNLSSIITGKPYALNSIFRNVHLHREDKFVCTFLYVCTHF